MTKKPTEIKDFPGRAVAAHLAATGALPGETQNEIKFVHDELQTAIRHLDHMAAWIGKQNAGYSFESLGEDMPSIRAALECARVHSACKEQDDRDSADLREALEAIKPGPSDALSPQESAPPPTREGLSITNEDRSYALSILEDLADPDDDTPERIVSQWVRKIRTESALMCDVPVCPLRPNLGRSQEASGPTIGEELLQMFYDAGGVDTNEQRHKIIAAILAKYDVRAKP